MVSIGLHTTDLSIDLNWQNLQAVQK